MAKLRSEVVEVIGNYKEFRGKIDYALSQLNQSEILPTISIATSETSKGTRYVAVILYRYDGW